MKEEIEGFFRASDFEVGGRFYLGERFRLPTWKDYGGKPRWLRGNKNES